MDGANYGTKKSQGTTTLLDSSTNVRGCDAQGRAQLLTGKLEEVNQVLGLNMHHGSRDEGTELWNGNGTGCILCPDVENALHNSSDRAEVQPWKMV